jgi:hypothetical protein
MYADLRDKLTVLLFQYSYKTIDEGLKELIHEYKYHFDQDYATINPGTNEITDKIVKISGKQVNESTKDIVNVIAEVKTEDPKKVVVKKPRKAKSGSKVSE